MKLIYIFIILLLNSLPIIAQVKTVFNSKNNNIAYIINNKKNNSVTDLFNVLNSNNIKLKKNLEITYEYVIEIIKKKEHSFQIKLDFNNYKLSEKILYKNIEISNLLLPDSISTQVNLFNNNKILKEFTSEAHLKFQKKNKKLLQFNFNYHNNNFNFTAEIEDIRFLYTDYKLKQLSENISFINNYKIILDSIEALNMQINNYLEQSKENNDFEIYFEYNEFTDSTLKYCSKNKNLFKNFDDSNFYAKDSFLLRLNKLEINANKLKDKCIKYISSLDEKYLNSAIDLINDNDFEKAKKQLQKAEFYNPQLAEIYLNYAIISYKLNNKDSIPYYLSLVYQKKPNENIKGLAKKLSNEIYNHYLKIANNYNTEGNFTSALQQLDFINLLCDSVKEIKKNTAYFTNYKTAINAKYNQYIKNIETAVINDNLLEAEYEIAKAKVLKNKYANFITDDKKIIVLHRRVYFDYISKGSLYNSIALFSDALLQLKNAKRICAETEYIPCLKLLDDCIQTANEGIYNSLIEKAFIAYNNDQFSQTEQILEEANQYCNKKSLSQNIQAYYLLLKLKQNKYSEIIRLAVQLRRRNNYKDALEQLKKAIVIQKKYEIKKDSLINVYIKENAILLITDYIIQAEKQIDINNLNQAKTKYNQALLLQIEYDLMNDKEAIKILNNFSDKLYGEKCGKIKRDYLNKLEKSKQFEQKNDYIYCSKMLESAIELYKNQTICYIDTDSVSLYIKKIKDAVNYQYEIISINNAIEKKHYKQAIEKYELIGKIFKKNKIKNRFNLNHLTTYTFIQTHTNMNFINYGVYYYTQKEQYQKALNLLFHLQKENYSKKQTKDNQKILAQKMAKNDLKENKSEKLKSDIKKYTKGERWFKYFKSAYLKVIK